VYRSLSIFSPERLGLSAQRCGTAARIHTTPLVTLTGIPYRQISKYQVTGIIVGPVSCVLRV
ncbi:MAG TPA: hypothetical protein VMG63_22055, partial [Terriglobia bacterium]|nr:hypothetical protein [Terriglobia bacterium]